MTRLLEFRDGDAVLALAVNAQAEGAYRSVIFQMLLHRAAQGAGALAVNDGDGLDAEQGTAVDELIDHQNQFAQFKGLTVEAAGQDEAGNDVAFLYNWDGSGSQGDDLYFNVSYNGETYTFTVESYLCDSTTEVYAAVEALQVGQVIDAEGFLYWYEGLNPHITSVTVVG